jgi:hypothetical protein
LRNQAVIPSKFLQALHASNFSARVRCLSDVRAWLTPENSHERLYALVKDLCTLAYPTLEKLVDQGEPAYEFCHDLTGTFRFPMFDTDHYPPDGYSSLFTKITSPFLNGGMENDAKVTVRSLDIFQASIHANPSHGEGNYSQTKPPRLRKSELNVDWGISVDQIFKNRQPTLNFNFYISDSNFRTGPVDYDDASSGLRELLGFNVVLGQSVHAPRGGIPIISIPEVAEILSSRKVQIVNTAVHSEKWLDATHSWHPFFEIYIRAGLFSTKKETIYLSSRSGGPKYGEWI